MMVPIFKIALRALARNKARSALTMLGIVIGVGSVIAMVSLGQGAQQQVQQQIAGMGDNLLIVMSGSRTSSGVRGGAGTSNRLTPEDAEAILREVPAVASVSPGVNSNVTTVFGNQNWTTRAEGVGLDYLSIRGRSIDAGEFFTESDIRSAARVAVIGQTVATELFGAADPVGQTIRVRNLPFRVVGTITAKGQSGMGQDQDDILYLPYTTVMKKLQSTIYISTIFVSAADRDSTAAAETGIAALLRSRHNIRAGQDDDFTVRNLTDVAEAAEESSRVMTMLLGGIAAVSLLVGGIGIMNIMLVSVTERTREIGIRMAVGARTSHVQHQFLIESLVLGLLGGIGGIFAGIATSLGVSYAFGWPQSISPLAVAGSALFSMAIGIFFGYYPAKKAAALDPIDALRFE
ncbi:MAG: ABC transporter permease [Bryobacterales bacterium]|nr:ABC transporter permease [Bryobacterales bacterium]